MIALETDDEKAERQARSQEYKKKFLDEMGLAERKDKRNETQRKWRANRKVRFEEISSKDRTDWTLEDHDFYLHYVQSRLSERRRNRRRQMLMSHCGKADSKSYVPSRYGSTQFMTGCISGADIFAKFRSKFKKNYPKETDMATALFAIDENGNAMFHLDETVPCIAFDKNPLDQSACWHFQNPETWPDRKSVVSQDILS